MSRLFHITDILSVTTGRLVSTRQMAGVYDILEYMTGEGIFTHQVPHARIACATALLDQHPYLATTHCRGINETNLARHTEAWISQFGEHLVVDKLDNSIYDFSNPVSDMAATVHPDRTFKFELDG